RFRILPYHRQMEKRPFRESQARIKFDGPNIVLQDMKKNRFATASNSPHHLGHQNSGITSAGVVPMSTNGADFSKTRNLEAFSRHGHQRSVTTNSEIRSELVGADAEWPGLG